jgi:hypothetical protein
VDPVRPERREEGGIPRVRREISAPPGAGDRHERWSGANDAKTEKLRGRSLQRRAGEQGLQLRHSAYGYALINSAREPVEDRSDMTLDEVESLLERPDDPA